MYKVIKFFTDLHDADYPYQVGDQFPRPGIEVTENRIAELSGSDNKQGVPLIALVEEQPETKKAVSRARKAAAKK
ncbi:MAG: hypothetical protein HFE64_03395 [Lachnospiraceae bacterium]|jgi:hypothetical protein|nr:hypothetical protein [Lachnospiraceae bacterium]